MPPVSVDAFASEFRGLPASERTEFVSAVWAARGWETTVEAGVVVAERGDDRRRIRVADPGRFGTPDLDGVDTIVAARDREAVQAAAVEAGVAYVPPADLRDLLLYGIERETAAEIYAEGVDRPLERTVTDEADEAGLLDTVLAAIPALGENRRAIVAILLVVLVGVVAAGPPLTGGDGPTQSPITVANGTPEGADGGAIGAESPTPTAMPGLSPGVTRAGVVDPTALAEAHVDGVRNRSRVVAWELTSPSGSSTGANTVRNATARIANASHYARRRAVVRPEDNWSTRVTDETYAGGSDVFRRISFPNETRYARYDLAEYPATTIDANVETYLYRYFVGADEAVVTCAIEYDTDCPTYRVEIDGDAPALLESEVEEYEALLIVSNRGVITTIRASYTLPDSDDDGEREQVRFALDYQFEAVDVTPPDWLSAARNATATETPTTEDGTATETG
ncbi:MULTISPECIES: hypothetical protein [Halolamina]|uniref:Uncharacterized protein n=1 Tax=Halolamina pelagica TaxID=699431 RepID=A0A1I5MIZ2_9EURY|nr:MULTISPECIES: hypothetical protein [Halolamina]NHX36049.1 hypothetical protein [Halolamina sp. R1-12]SFP09555.1 hypothetical protein SAMN05216277_101293 [Halolamina pelagica]